MVSIDESISLLQLIRDSAKANGLYSFLDGGVIHVPDVEQNERDKIYYSILQALAKSQQSNFRANFDEMCNRRVVEDQPIVYDNFLLFALIVGAIKFGASKEWLKNVLGLRTTQNEPEKSITSAFQNLLDSNSLTTDGIPSVVMAGLLKAGKQDFDALLLANAFEGNKKINLYLKKDLFLASIVLYTNNYIISLSISHKAFRLKKFETSFLNRVKVLQNTIYVLILILITILWFYAIKKYPQIKPVANDFGMLLQIIGIGIFAYLLNKVKDQFGVWIKKFFGYKE